jgi:hypothetical protein
MRWELNHLNLATRIAFSCSPALLIIPGHISSLLGE